LKHIAKIKLKNFRRFESITIDLDPSLNVLIGENEAGKSSLLQAINLTLSASKSQIDTVGVERLLNADVVESFCNLPQKSLGDLPLMYVELYLNEDDNFIEAGTNNSEDRDTHGLRMTCKPNDSLSEEISEVISSEDSVFPFDYYEVKFETFSGQGYTGYRKFVSHLLIDTSTVSTEYAMRSYVNRMYDATITATERSKHQHEYRRVKDQYQTDVLESLNDRIDEYDFGIRTDGKSNLSSDLTLIKDGVGIESLGKGRQCFIKTAFALRQSKEGKRAIDVLLLEEPENHLSHVNMNKLVREIRDSEQKQLIIATHSNMLTARLDLRHAILLHSASDSAATLKALDEDTAKFFIKAPDRGILDFALSKNAILVEGDAEYILMEQLFFSVTGQTPSELDVHILSVGGLSFKRYLAIADLLNIKVAVIRDNDGDYQQNCVERYAEYAEPNICVFGDHDYTRSTFEICVYQDNQQLCDSLFSEGRRSLTVQDYMLANKTETAYQLLADDKDLSVPHYIIEAVQWLIAD
jgi:putative ATP-dependent endonuclease of OLD family